MRAAKHVVVLAGAGISVSCGVGVPRWLGYCGYRLNLRFVVDKKIGNTFSKDTYCLAAATGCDAFADWCGIPGLGPSLYVPHVGCVGGQPKNGSKLRWECGETA